MTLYHSLKETPYESRNLGRPAYAIADSFLAAPDGEILAGELDRLRQEQPHHFIFLRLPKERLLLAEMFERQGFYLVESTVSPVLQLDRLPDTPEPLREELEFAILEPGKDFPLAELEKIATESFCDDRFHIDHRCPKELADRRFAYWIQDLAATPSTVFEVLKLRGEIVGFIARKGNFFILSGFSPAHAGAGLGRILWTISLQGLRQAGHSTLETHVSVNNLAVLNLCIKLGFRLRNPHYGFHLWHG